MCLRSQVRVGSAFLSVSRDVIRERGSSGEDFRVGRLGLESSVCYLPAGNAGQVSELSTWISSPAFTKYLLNSYHMHCSGH